MYELAINLAFPPKRVNQAEYYEDVLEEAARQGLTIFRLWLSDFSFNYYSFRGETHDFNLDLLAHVGSAGASRGMKVIPVLFDFNEFTTTNIHWSDYEHTFQTSFISKFLKEPKDFFHSDNLEIGLSKFLKIREILAEGNIHAWEIFNEIDLVKGFNHKSALDWAGRFSEQIGRVSEKPIYLSFADPTHVGKPAGVPPHFKLAIHTYSWPYSEFYKNVIYWQNKYPLNWVMEFGSPNATRAELLVALVASFILNQGRLVAMPWYWDETLKTHVYTSLRKVLDQIGEYVRPGDRYEFTGELGGGRRSPRYRDVRNTLKLAGLRGLLSKARTTARLLTPAPPGGCHLKFENERLTIVIDADFLQSASPERNGATLLTACDADGVRLKVYARG